jgi:hypothetical protein
MRGILPRPPAPGKQGFDNQNDPKHRDLRDQLRQRLAAWQQSINDPVLVRPKVIF